MECLLSSCKCALILLFLSASTCSQEDGAEIAEVISHNLELPSQDGVYFVMEGTSFNVCCPRTGKFSKYEQISVMVNGRSMSISNDFMIEPATISEEENCTTISIGDDDVIERNKAFDVTLRPHLHRDENTENQSSTEISFTVILEDNDSPSSIECSRSFIHTMNITAVFQERNSCATSADVFSQCNSPRSIDCTRWNPDLVSLLESQESNTLFPNIDPEFMTASGRSCIDSLKDHLASAFEEGDEKCYTNCTATLSSECSISVFLLENIDSRRIPDLRSPGPAIPAQCGVFELTSCCTESLPSECLDPASVGGSDSSLPVGAIVGGVVGSVVVLAAIIVLAVVTGVVICVMKRKKKQKKQWERGQSPKVQPILYKPKRMESTGAVSNISQGSTTASTAPLTLENGGSSTITPLSSQPNYEEVTYTESYTKWKKKFAKVIVDAKDLEYGDVIGEGEFSKVYKAEYAKPGESSMQVAVKNLKTVSDHKEIEKFIAESAIMKDFDHPNILRLIGVCFNMEDNLPAIILPYMALGDLRSFLRAKRAALVTSTSKEAYPEGLSEVVMIGMCMDIARGMHYLSKCKLVHRDLAARNCMVDDQMRVKVADFGLSRDIRISDYYRLTHRQKLPVKWMAPESLFKKIYNLKTDVWSYGIVCWEVFKLGKKPYAGIDNPDLPNYISHGFRPKKPSRCPNEVFKLMQEMWSEDPEQRPDFREIVLSLADLMHYGGDIESDLVAETKNCLKVKKEHNYHELEYPYQVAEVNFYSVLEEPVYHNFSREESSLDSPEEYEVPQPVSSTSNGTPHAEYEMPVPSSQDAESVDVDAILMPMEYEVPQSEGAILNGGDSAPRVRPNHLPQRSLTNHKLTGSADRSRVAASDGEYRRASVPLVHNSATVKLTNPPRHDRSSPHRSPAHRRRPLATSPVNIRGANRHEDHTTRAEREVSPGYLRLSYPAIEKESSVPPSSRNSVSTPDRPYSTLEWKKNSSVSNSHSLPQQFTVNKSHVYQTLDFPANHSQ